MSSLKQNAAHIIVVVVIIISAVVLALHNNITGTEALTVIGTAGGFSLGGAGASASVGTLAQALGVISASGGSSTPALKTPTAGSPTPSESALTSDPSAAL